MIRFTHGIAAAALMASVLLLCDGAQAQLVASYGFNNTLAADQGGAPALTAVNSGAFTTANIFGQSHSVYQRTSASNASASQSALRLDTTPLSLIANNYAVEIVFNFTDNLSPNGYRRVLDSFDPSSLQDPGLYVGPGSTLNIYQSGPHSGGTSLIDRTFYDVLLSVSSTGEQAYLNGTQVVSYAGTPDSITTHFLTFFQDNTTEYGNGNVGLIRVFDRSLTTSEASALNNNGNPFTGTLTAAAPEPSSLALLVLPALGVLVARRRTLTA